MKNLIKMFFKIIACILLVGCNINKNKNDATYDSFGSEINIEKIKAIIIRMEFENVAEFNFKDIDYNSTYGRIVLKMTSFSFNDGFLTIVYEDYKLKKIHLSINLIYIGEIHYRDSSGYIYIYMPIKKENK